MRVHDGCRDACRDRSGAAAPGRRSRRFGVLPAADALAIGDRVWPILLFVVAVTIVAELARAGVFDAAAHAWRACRADG
jgi:hypothetical protein